MTLHEAELLRPVDPRLGRHVEFDRRSADYPIRALLTAPQVRAPRAYTWRLDPAVALDQGDEGSCVGFSIAQEFASRPAVRVVGPEAARQLYWLAQREDAWPGGAYPGAEPRYEGTSVLAGAKVAAAMGYWREYRWGFSLEDAVAAIAWTGPVVFGLSWYEGMMEPEPDGRIRPTGAEVGGHAIEGNAVDVRRRRVWLANSWGLGWGVGGRAYLTWDDLGDLLDRRGETCVPVGRAR